MEKGRLIADSQTGCHRAIGGSFEHQARDIECKKELFRSGDFDFMTESWIFRSNYCGMRPPDQYEADIHRFPPF